MRLTGQQKDFRFLFLLATDKLEIRPKIPKLTQKDSDHDS